MRNPCCDKQDVNKGAWSKQEDQKLIDYVMKHGEGCWRTLPQAAGLLRCGKSCRLRWINYLRPELKKGNFAEDEEDLIIKLHALLGNRWSLIAGRLPGRTDNQVKNYWNSHLRKKLINMGIDPNNHRLRNPPIMSGSSASSHGLQDNAKNNESTKLLGDMEDESFCLPDLNSDLCVSNDIPSSSHPPPPITAQGNHNPIHETSETSSEMQLVSSPTLLLFR